MRIIVFILITILLSACTQNSSIYYWGSYSKSLYETKKNPSEKTEANHEETLTQIISKSKSKGKPIPPGVCLEYADILFKKNDKGNAISYLNQEKQFYPESSAFVDFLIEKVYGGTDEKK